MSEIRMRYVGRHQEPFGDTKTTWEIESDLPKHKVMEFSPVHRSIHQEQGAHGHHRFLQGHL